MRINSLDYKSVWPPVFVRPSKPALHDIHNWNPTRGMVSGRKRSRARTPTKTDARGEAS